MSGTPDGMLVACAECILTFTLEPFLGDDKGKCRDGSGKTIKIKLQLALVRSKSGVMVI